MLWVTYQGAQDSPEPPKDCYIDRYQDIPHEPAISPPTISTNRTPTSPSKPPSRALPAFPNLIQKQHMYFNRNYTEIKSDYCF